MISIGKSLSASLLSNLWLVLLLIILTPYYVSLLGVESYGLIGFYTSLVAILGILDMGISTTATREIAWRTVRPVDKKTIPVLLRSLEIIYWTIVIIIGSALLILAWIYGADWFQSGSLKKEVVQRALMLMAVSLIVQVPSGLYSGGLIGLHRQVQNSTLLTLFGTARGIGAVLILWKVSPDIRAFFLWQIIVSLIQVFVMRVSLLRRINPLKCTAQYSSVMISTVKGFAGGMTLITALSLAVSQADKLILSRTVALVDYGYYMLAWSVASGLMLIAMPLMQTYSPLFTKLISENDEKSLEKQFKLSSQLMSVMVLPPAAFIILLSKPILYAWLGNAITVENTAPILTLLTIGTMLIACAYPALYMIYSRKQLRLIIIVQLIILVVLLPMLVFAISKYGITGAAFCWILFSVVLYMSYQTICLQGFSGQRVFISILSNFVAPCVVAFLSAVIFGSWLSSLEGRILFIICSVITLLITWLLTLFICDDLRLSVLSKINLASVFSS